MRRQTKWHGTLSTLGLLAFLLAGCGRATEVAPYIPPSPVAPTPTSSGVDITLAPLPPLVAESETETPTPDELLPSPTPPCVPSLKYVQDVTVPDDTVVAPGSTVDKKWLVQNDGGCDWDSHYRLKLSDGIEMGLPTEQALYPARAGTQAVIEMMFTAPADPGTYRSAWRPFAPDGTEFGDTIYMEIIVSP